MGNKLQIGLVIIGLGVLVGLVAFLFRDDIFTEDANVATQTQNNVDLEETGTNTETDERQANNDIDIENEEPSSEDIDDGEEGVSNEEDMYNFVYEVEATIYEPDSENYVGFRVCDASTSTCTVYGVKDDYIAKAILGNRYKLHFNELGSDQNVAAGTNYILVVGDMDDVWVEDLTTKQ